MSIKDILFNHLNDNDVVDLILKEKKLQEIEDKARQNYKDLVDYIDYNFEYMIDTDIGTDRTTEIFSELIIRKNLLEEHTYMTTYNIDRKEIEYCKYVNYVPLFLYR